jgi:hypothetical protein
MQCEFCQSSLITEESYKMLSNLLDPKDIMNDINPMRIHTILGHIVCEKCFRSSD